MFEVLAESNPHKTSGAASEPQVSPQSPQSAKGQAVLESKTWPGGNSSYLSQAWRGKFRFKMASFTGRENFKPWDHGIGHGMVVIMELPKRMVQ